GCPESADRTAAGDRRGHGLSVRLRRQGLCLLLRHGQEDPDAPRGGQPRREDGRGSHRGAESRILREGQMIVEARALAVRFRRGLFRRRFAALAGLDLDVHDGDFFALLGPNGAGKTTAMHCLLGLLRPTSGEVRVMGERPEPGAALFARVAYLPEEPRYPEYLTVHEAVMYYARLSRVAEPARRVAGILDRLELGEHRKLAIRRCSKGMKQKVGIAQCLAHEPRLVFLDEPMRGLDPMTVHAFREALRDMNRDGATVVMNSHLLSAVELVANRVAVIDKGRLLVQDEVAHLVRGDSGEYAVEITGPAETPPASLRGATRTGANVRGTVAREGLYDFMEDARAKQFEIVSCELSRARLEDRVLAILQEGRAHA